MICHGYEGGQVLLSMPAKCTLGFTCWMVSVPLILFVWFNVALVNTFGVQYNVINTKVVFFDLNSFYSKNSVWAVF